MSTTFPSVLVATLTCHLLAGTMVNM
jgi:hypothetical protein